MRFLDATLDTYQDTSGYMYLGLLITIHQDTPRYKIKIHVSWRLGRVMTTLQDTIRIHAKYMRDPCGIHVSAEVRGYMQDTYMIHAR